MIDVEMLTHNPRTRCLLDRGPIKVDRLNLPVLNRRNTFS